MTEPPDARTTYSGPDHLEPDDVARSLGKCHPLDLPEGYVSFKGYLGPPMDDTVEPADDKVHPVYLADEFRSWILVRAGDIKARVNVPPNATDPRSVIFVERCAKVTHCEAGPAHEVADEVARADPAGRALKSGRPPY